MNLSTCAEENIMQKDGKQNIICPILRVICTLATNLCSISCYETTAEEDLFK